MVSGDQFISDGAVKDRLISRFDGSCAEMEGAAIAHAAFLNQIPYVVLRAISDKADGSATWTIQSLSEQPRRTARNWWRIWSAGYKV